MLPLGVYYILMSLTTNVALITLLLTPIAVLCSFQVVLLFLYGESIIAVDMYINVATTNVNEATELLSNMPQAITLVIALYLPPLIASIVMLCKKQRSCTRDKINARYAAAISIVIALISIICSYASGKPYNFARELFPINVISNFREATRRSAEAEHYYDLSRSYDYHAQCTAIDSVPEIYILIIGETSRADNWQLFGYKRHTNPQLSKRNDLITYNRTMSESNTTHKSVPMLLSPLSSTNFKDSIAKVKSIFAAFNQSGFTTFFISNQKRDKWYIDKFAAQAHQCIYTSENYNTYDISMLPVLQNFLDTCHSKRVFIVMHSHGSHYRYTDRYTPDFEKFKPCNFINISVQNKDKMINAYDNTICYTDNLIDNIITMLEKRADRAAVIYTSDHGEDLLDDERNRCMHASPTPTYWQLHVPLLIWMSSGYKEAYPALYANALTNRDKYVSSTQSVFNTIIDMSGIRSKGYNADKSLCSDSYTSPKFRYLNDYNESVKMSETGFSQNDIDHLYSMQN